MNRLSTTLLATGVAGLLMTGTAAAEPPPSPPEGSAPTAPSTQDQLDILGSLPVGSTLSSYLAGLISGAPLTEFATPVVEPALSGQTGAPTDKRSKRLKPRAKPTGQARPGKSHADEPPAGEATDPVSSLLNLGFVEGEGLLAGLPIVGDIEPSAKLLGPPSTTP